MDQLAKEIKHYLSEVTGDKVTANPSVGFLLDWEGCRGCDSTGSFKTTGLQRHVNEQSIKRTGVYSGG